jgi:hypothetical protein
MIENMGNPTPQERKTGNSTYNGVLRRIRGDNVNTDTIPLF